MTRAVWKFAMDAPTLTQPMGEKSRVVCVANQDNTPTLWVEVNLEEMNEMKSAAVSRTFQLYGTGHPIRDDNQVYVGTAHGIDGWMVLHVYEVT